MGSATETADVIVIGAGTMGSMALWHLSRMRGEDGKPLRVVGIEQFGRVHANGAFHGESRLFRVAVKEGRLFVPALLEARSQWLELGRLAGRDILIPSGVLHVAPRDHEDLAETRAGIAEYGLASRELSADELRAQYPQFAVEDQDAGILDELGGALRPEAAVFAATRLAEAGGAEIRYNTRVTGLEERGDNVRVTTEDGVVDARRAIVTAGPWTGKLLPGLAELVRVAQYNLLWFMPRDITKFMPSVFPGFMRDLDGEHAFGTPSIEGFSVKVTPHYALPEYDDADKPRSPLTREDLRWMGAFAHRVFPDLDPEPSRWSMHPDSQTASKRPIIDTVADGKIVVTSGRAGNGFKFAPVWGQAAAELALTGETRWRDEEFTIAHQRTLLG